MNGEHKSRMSAALEEHFTQWNKKYKCIPLGTFEERPDKLRDLRI